DWTFSCMSGGASFNAWPGDPEQALILLSSTLEFGDGVGSRVIFYRRPSSPSSRLHRTKNLLHSKDPRAPLQAQGIAPVGYHDPLSPAPAVQPEDGRCRLSACDRQCKTRRTANGIGHYASKKSDDGISRNARRGRAYVLGAKIRRVCDGARLSERALAARRSDNEHYVKS